MAAELDHAQQSLAHWFRGKTLVRVASEAGARPLRGCDLGLFNALSGRLSLVACQGPALALKFSCGLTLWVQLGDAAKFLQRTATDEVKASRARFFLDDGSVVHLQDHAQLSRVEVVRSRAKGALDLGRRAPSVKQLQAALDGSSQELKVALRDQAQVTGLESARVDAALLAARVHPERVAASLSPPEWQALVRALDPAAVGALEAGCGCPRCGAPLSELLQSGDRTRFCAACQPRRKNVALPPPHARARPRRYRG